MRNVCKKQVLKACINLLLVVVTMGTVQAQREVTGTVTDEVDEGLPGVYVLLSGSSNAAVTDLDGGYTITVNSNSDTLVFQMLGMETQKFAVGNQSTLDVKLVPSYSDMNEVVVVGYGVQKKVNLTGSVASVDMADVTASRPITTLSSGLSGLASGLSVSQGNGRPGGDNATLRIRGQGTLNNADPLVIIDGAVGNINDINPQDVENVSVLKDAASAAIYGSRAANGVILITTKQGKEGVVRVNYNSYYSITQPTNLVKTVTNYANYMELINEGYKNTDPNSAQIFSQESIDLWRANESGDPLKYPNVNWADEVFQSNLLQNHNLSFNGGTEKIRYFGSFGFLDNPGIIEKAGYQRYVARLNLEADLKPWLTLGMRLNGLNSKTDIGTNILDDVFTYAAASSPGMVLRAPDGRFGSVNNPEDDSQSNNVLHRLHSRKGAIEQNKMVTRFYGILRPIEGLTVEGSFNYTFDDEFMYEQPVFNDRWNFLSNTIASSGVGRTSVTNRNEKDYNYFMDGIIRYDREITNGLQMNLMVGASQEYYKNLFFSASKLDLVDPGLSVIDAATMDASASGNASDWGMRSFFGRLNLVWQDKYLFEANIRRDGTSRFAAGSSRWGVFPSFSAGWRIVEEDFLKEVQWLDDLKIRASWGSLGNNAVGDYEYQAVYNSSNYILNNSLYVGFAQTALSNAALTWESTYITNLGVDYGFLSGKLSGSLDLFHKLTKNILINLPAPSVVGNASIPKQNAAEVLNKGVEVNLTWRDNIGKVSYHVGGNFSYIKNEVTKFKGEDRTIDGSNLIQEGYPINVQYVRAVDRIIQTEQDLQLVQNIIENAPVNSSTGEKVNPFASYGVPQWGDLLYRDLNGDGVINDDDRYTVGNGTAPHIVLGLNFGLNYRNFDLSGLVQGNIGLQTFYLDSYFRPSVRYGNQINQEIAEGRWVPGRTDAEYPRLLDYSQTKNSLASDFWIQDRSFVRLKNIQLGYTIPAAIIEKIKLSSVRVYGSLENYFTYTKYKGFDPEVDGADYPTLKQALIGLSVSF
jgi:TonB-linked SusC/RagA family outer membrane protein